MRTVSEVLQRRYRNESLALLVLKSF